MSNVVPVQTKITDTLDFRSQGDFDMVTTLLKNPRYKVPERLRQKIMDHAEGVIDNINDSATLSEQNAACKMILEADKRNIDIVKMCIPKQHVHTHVSELSDRELEEELQRIIDERGLVPSLCEGTQEISDA